MPDARLKMDTRQLTKLIKERALAEGFDKVGVVAAEALMEERAQLAEWTRRGFHASMRWLAANADYPDNIERRTDPRVHFPHARSVVCVALNYYTAHEHESSDLSSSEPISPRGKISRYAWGDDYHDIVSEKLKRLLAWIKAQIDGAEGKVACDIQPMMDKAWAQRAGLGWIGKHSNLITRDLGSWVFLGELILNIELDYDAEVVSDYCGSCRLCIEACPTDAIVQERVVDSNKCISYHTIESRDAELPAHIVANQTGWLYGCDICQDVCPWNRFEQPTDETRFEPRADETALAIDEVLQMSPEDYAARFRRSPVKRAKLAGLQRNAMSLLQNNRTLDPTADVAQAGRA